MPPRKQVMIDPGRGGKTIPDAVKLCTEERIRRYAEQHFAGRYTRLDIRFRGQFCYIHAYTEPQVMPGWPPPGGPETQEEYIARLRATPTYLCRLRFFGDEDRWGFAFYTYSHERYELSMFPTGDFFGRPEDAFHVSPNAYL